MAAQVSSSPARGKVSRPTRIVGIYISLSIASPTPPV
jgi:hypothetical protein